MEADPQGSGCGSKGGGRERTAGNSKHRAGGRKQSGTPAKTAENQPQQRREGSGGAGRAQDTKHNVGASPVQQQQKQRKNNVFKKKMEPPFAVYWSKEDVQRGLKTGDLVQGILRINPRNFEDAYVDDPEGGTDYYVEGMRCRNRALDRDVVAIKVLPPQEWVDENQTPNAVTGAGVGCGPVSMCTQPGSTEGTNRSETLNSPVTTLAESVVDLPVSPGEPDKDTLVDRLYTAPDGFQAEQKEGLYEGSRKGIGSILSVKRTAMVVYIVERVYSRACAGHLRQYDRAGGQVLFSPKDNKVCRVIIPLSDCPADYIQNMKKYENTLFICRITNWHPHSPFAHGQLLRSMGEAGEIEPETESFLIENDIDWDEFPPEALECLPQARPWSIPQEEEARRRDFRKECVFSIDPETARDLDDALHVKEVDNGVYEVGVHIADVTYFVRSDTALDQMASSRATSVYLVQKVIPMLPRLLCEELCSLNPNEDRLSFSVVWRMTSKGEFLDEWMGRSMIRSCAKLTYSNAQDMIENPERVWSADQLPTISNGFSTSNVSSGVNTLNKLAKVLRAQRESRGTLRLNQPKLKFSVDRATGLPNGCDVYRQRESNSLIEEFMLLANMAVARKLWGGLPELAMLRRHPWPKEKSAERLVQGCLKLGIPMDVGSAALIQQSLDQYQGREGADPARTHLEKMALVSMCSKIMELARYFCAGSMKTESSFMHYALNVPLYTHFTSPIRRYADVVVHRQLASVLGQGPSYSVPEDEVRAQAEHCNKKKKSAKTVEELSSEMFFAIFVKECGPLSESGIVTQVLDKSFDVLVERYGVIKRVYCEKLDIQESKCTKDKSGLLSLHLDWSQPGSSPLTQELKVMSEVTVILKATEKTLKYEAIIQAPVQAPTI